jgi:O-antigen ligase
MMYRYSVLVPRTFSLRLKHVVSLENFYVLYILSGVFKGFLAFWNLSIGVDITLALAFIVLAWFFFETSRGQMVVFQRELPSLLGVGTLLLVVIATLLYTKSPSFGYLKALLFLTNLIAFCVPLMLKKFSYQRFFKFYILYSFLTAALFAYYANLFGNASVTISQKDTLLGIYLVIGTNLGLALLILLFDNSIRGYLKAVVSVVFGIVLLASGARGPIVFTFLLILGALLHKVLLLKIARQSIRTSFLVIMLLMLAFVATFVANSGFSVELQADFTRATSRTISRFEALDESSQFRLNLFSLTWDYITRNPVMGYGFGSFGYVMTGSDERDYPHNTFLEIWFELGLLGLLVWLAFLTRFLGLLLSRGQLLQGLIFVYLLLNISKSYSLSDLRLVFAFLACILLMQRVTTVNPVSVKKAKKPFKHNPQGMKAYA